MAMSHLLIGSKWIDSEGYSVVIERSIPITVDLECTDDPLGAQFGKIWQIDSIAFRCFRQIVHIDILETKSATT